MDKRFQKTLTLKQKLEKANLTELKEKNDSVLVKVKTHKK